MQPHRSADDVFVYVVVFSVVAAAACGWLTEEELPESDVYTLQEKEWTCNVGKGLQARNARFLASLDSENLEHDWTLL